MVEKIFLIGKKQGVAVTLPFRSKPTSYLRPAILMDEEMSDGELPEDEQPVRATKPFYYFPVTLLTFKSFLRTPNNLKREVSNA